MVAVLQVVFTRGLGAVYVGFQLRSRVNGLRLPGRRACGPMHDASLLCLEALDELDALRLGPAVGRDSADGLTLVGVVRELLEEHARDSLLAGPPRLALERGRPLNLDRWLVLKS